MSDNAISYNPNNRNVFEAHLNMADRQPSKISMSASNGADPQIPSQIDPNLDIIKQLNLPPLSSLQTAGGPKLDAMAPAFTPNGIGNSLALQTERQQTQLKVQESMAKLQVLAFQLNHLNTMNQQNRTLLSIQQYQSVYNQYQLEVTNTMLLTQYLSNLDNLQKLQQQTMATPTPNPLPIQTTPGGLETIEEGGEEDEEGITDSQVAAPSAPGTDTQSQSEHEVKSSEMIEDAESETMTGLIGETESQKGEKTVNLNKKPSELEKIKKQIRGILNKITPENFSKLSQDIASILKLADIASSKNHESASWTAEQLKVAQKAQFKALIRLILKCILEKAVNESLFSNQYARLCYSLYLYAEHSELKKKIFRLQLISLCHSIFKKSRAAKDSARFIGIITMIGDLFFYGLISWNVISSGILEELLPPAQAFDIEAICKLLKTSGHEFDKHHRLEIDNVINKLRKYAKNFGFRTQCFVQEIDEMRQNDWKQRKDTKQESPKTLNQIHMEFNQEKVTQAVDHRRIPSSRRRNVHHHHGYHGHNGYNKRYNGHHNNHRYGRYNNNKNGGNQRKKHRAMKPTVEFVRDVTLPDRSHYPANKRLTKTWAMRNSGELCWGNDVELVYFKGDKTLSLRDKYSVPNVQPGQQVYISADIETPSQPGRYCTYFRLSKNNKFFGPRVWVDIIVSDQ